MTTMLSQDEVNKAVWCACDTFRGTISSDIYREYVLTMLFLKYLSDVWQDKYDAYKKEFGDKKMVQALLQTERFVLPMEADFYSLYAKRFDPGNGERIDKALHAIEEANITKLERVFQDISFNSGKLGEETQKNDLLRLLLEDFNKPALNLRPSRVGTLDIIGNAYEYLIRMFASDAGKKAGEYYTPPEVSQLMAELVDPKEGDEICDPACGSASLLMKCGYKVLFIDASRDYADGKNQNALRPQDIQKIVDTFRARQSVEKYACLANVEEIKANDYNLNIPRYVDTFEEEPEIDMRALLTERADLKAELERLEGEMEKYLKELGYVQ